MSDPNVTSVQVLLPVTFFNQGYSEGIVETIKLIVKAEQRGTTSIFLPAMEVDMVAFVQQRQGINSSNMLGTRSRAVRARPRVQARECPRGAPRKHSYRPDGRIARPGRP